MYWDEPIKKKRSNFVYVYYIQNEKMNEPTYYILANTHTYIHIHQSHSISSQWNRDTIRGKFIDVLVPWMLLLLLGACALWKQKKSHASRTYLWQWPCITTFQVFLISFLFYEMCPTNRKGSKEQNQDHKKDWTRKRRRRTSCHFKNFLNVSFLSFPPTFPKT